MMDNVQTRENNSYFYLYFRVKYFRMNISLRSHILNIVNHLNYHLKYLEKIKKNILIRTPSS